MHKAGVITEVGQMPEGQVMEDDLFDLEAVRREIAEIRRTVQARINRRASVDAHESCHDD